MRVLLVHSSAELYGSDRCLVWVASGLREKGFDIEIVLPFPGPLEDELAAIGARVHILDPIVFRRDVLGPLSLAKLAAAAGPAAARLRRLIKANKVDIVQSNTGVVMGGALGAKLAGVPHIWHFREMLTEFSSLWRLYEPFVVGMSEEIVCISKAVAGQFRSERAAGKLTVVNDGIPLVDGPARSLGRPDAGTARLLSVGRLAPYKSQDVLISAVRKLLDRGLDVELTIVGDIFGSQHGYKERLKAMVADLNLKDRVEFAGFCPDIKTHLENTDIFIHPTRRPEGLGLVVLEAMSYGIPVVATRGGGVSEIIRDHSNGILAEPGDPDDLARAIGDLIANPQQAHEYGQEGLNTVKERFQVGMMNDNLARVYDRVLAAS